MKNKVILFQKEGLRYKKNYDKEGWHSMDKSK